MRRVRFALILLLACFLFANSVWAMSSPNYEIDWMVPLSGGGGPASSTNYAVHLTIGQSAIGASESTSFQSGLGFWNGIRDAVWELFMPLITK